MEGKLKKKKIFVQYRKRKYLGLKHFLHSFLSFFRKRVCSWLVQSEWHMGSTGGVHIFTLVSYVHFCMIPSRKGLNNASLLWPLRPSGLSRPWVANILTEWKKERNIQNKNLNSRAWKRRLEIPPLSFPKSHGHS